jgi:phage terminase large subunit-like protein
MSDSYLERLFKAYGKEKISTFLKQDNNHILLNEWKFIARPEQLPPSGDWGTWFLRAGRGFGKTLTGVMWCYHQKIVKEKLKYGTVVGATSADVRDYIVEGPAGFLQKIPYYDRPIYHSSKRAGELIFPNHGAKLLCFSAEEPERFRSHQGEFVWMDEFAAWKRAEYAYDMIMFGERMGNNPQKLITTTPRPLQLIKRILAEPDTVQTTGTTYDNKLNVSLAWIERIKRKYGGSRLGRQEINAEILEDNEEALFNRETIDKYRIGDDEDLKFDKIVVALDPSGTSHEASDECGIVAVGMKVINKIRHYYVLADRSCRKDPNEWARVAVNLHNEFSANMIVAETNYGGKMVETTLRAARFNGRIREVRASVGKRIRAEPVSVLNEQGRIHMVGSYPKLEDEMCQWDVTQKDYSPNRLDAFVWGVSSMMKRERGKLDAR